MKKIHHLTFQDRQTIEEAISQGKTKAEIGRILGKDPAGIAREIRRHREFKPRNKFNHAFLCENRKKCRKGCHRPCPSHKEPTCSRRDTSPGACNGCDKRIKCPMDKYFYNAKRADAAYRKTLVVSREGINITPEERTLIGNTIAPLLNKGQSVYQVLNNHPEIELSDRTLYRYIETGVFKEFKLDNFSLKEQVNRKQFKNKYKKRKEPANYNGRRYADFVAFRQENPECHIVEMDTLYNHSSGPFLQTFIFANVGFMIGRIHNARTSESMAASLNHYQKRLGDELFYALFQILLTDRGSEYEKFHLFEKDESGNDRLRIFYCDPMQSSQKPHVENSHNFVRDIIPNGKDLGSLTQDDINTMFSHINSVPRKSMKGRTPFEAFSFFFGNEVAELLDIKAISPDEVILNPTLIFK